MLANWFQQKFCSRAVPAVFAAVNVGVLAVIYQSICTREALVVLGGNELVLGVVLACWYLGLMAGALLGRRAAPETAPLQFAVLLSLFSCGGALSVAVLRFSSAFGLLRPYELIGVAELVTVCMIAVLPVAGLSGALFPVCAALYQHQQSEASAYRGTTRIYLYEAFASLFAGLAMSLVLLPHVGIEPMLLGCLLVSLAHAATQLLWIQHRKGAALLLCCLLLVGAAWSVGLLDKAATFSRSTRFAAYGAGYQALAERDSRYQNIVLAVPSGTSATQPTSIALFGNGQHVLTMPDPYSQAQGIHLAMAQHPAPKKVLLVGGASIGATEEYLLHGVEQLDYIELDAELFSLVESHAHTLMHSLLSTSALRILHADARAYVRQTQSRYDVVVIDVSHAQAASNRIATREFFEAVLAVLNRNACVVVRTAAGELTASVLRFQAAASIYQAMRAVFAHLVVIPGADMLFVGAQHSDVISDDAAVLSQRLKKRSFFSNFFAVDEIPLLLDGQHIAATRDSLLGAQVHANTDLQPSSYFYNLITVLEASGLNISPLTSHLTTLNVFVPMIALIGIGLSLALALARALRKSLRRRAGLQGVALACLLSSGASASALSLLLMYAFEQTFASVYSALAALVGAFMLGLGLGTMIAERYERADAAQALLRAECANLACCAVVAGVVVWAHRMPGNSAAVLLIVATVVCGVVAGISFCASVQASHGNAASIAARADAADCLGAACGALSVSFFALPLFGTLGTIAIVAAAKSATMLMLGPLLLSRR